MSNRFQIEVQAIDRYTKVFRDLNNKASKAARPLVNVQRQVGALAREMHLDKLAQGMGKVSDAAITVSRTLGLSLGPLESMLGAGGILGGLALAAGGAVALGVNFARTGFEVGRTSQAIGVSTRDLQQWRGAMQLAGIDADVANQALTNLGHTLQDARMNRDIPALNILRNLGIGIPMKNGTVDAAAALEAVAREMAKITDPQVRAKLAEVLHIPQEAIPALMQGAEAMARYRQKAEELGVVIDESGIQTATEFTMSLNLLKVAIEGTANSLGSKLVPSMAKALDYLTKMTVASGKDHVGGAWEGIKDAFLSGPRFVGWLGSTALHGNVPTTEAQRHVAGAITGPAPAGAATSAGRGGNDLSATETASLDDFTPAERARQQANEDSAENRRELVRELARQRDPAARAVLQGELTKIDQRLQVEVTLRGAPPGSSASARVVSAAGPAATARVQFAMPTLDMP